MAAPAPLPRALPVLGWREWISLPDLGIAYIKAKIDTGAKTSSLHAFAMEPFVRKGKRMIRFRVHPFQRDSFHTVEAEAPLLGERRIRTSGGHESTRPVIGAHVEVLGRRWRIELTLAPRDEMGFRMLLGRQGLRSRFLVHPGRSYLAGAFRRRPARRTKGRAVG
ncbi:MAG: ATP-dependent zinc protease family protein [Planctomycetota bacterium]